MTGCKKQGQGKEPQVTDNGDEAEPGITDGENETPVGEIRGNRPGNYSAQVVESDGWIYYTSFPFEDVKKVRVDGSGVVVLSSDSAASFNLLDGWLYYVCDDGLVKLRTDGTGREVLYARPEPYVMQYLSLVDGYFYFALMQHKMDGVGIFKLPLAGGQAQRLSFDMPYRGMCVTGGWIYYPIGAEGSIYRMRTDGSDKTLLGYGFYPIVEEGWLYYANETAIHRKHLASGEQAAMSVDLYDNRYNVIGDVVYYVHKVHDLKLHRFTWGAGGTEVAADDEVLDPYPFETALYYKHHMDWRTYRVAPGTVTGVPLP